MYEKILRFFIDNWRMNYLFFGLIFVAGIYAYIKTPKEIFPSFELSMISISGGYSGTSIDILDKMAVVEIESSIKNIDGIKEMTTIISPSKFNIILELQKRVDRFSTADKIKDAISSTKQSLPVDMDEPIVQVIEIKRDLLNIALTSDTLSKRELIQRAEVLKDRLSDLKNISEITIHGESDIYYDITLNSKKIRALGLDQKSIVKAISGISYIYPIGEIEDSNRGYHYISTYNGKKSQEDILNSRIKVLGKTLYLKDIADIKKRLKDASTIFMVDGVDGIDLSIKQSPVGNALELSEEIYKVVDKLNRDSLDVEYIIHNDHSIRIKDRLNIIISNILLGLILITLLVMLLINRRISFVIFLGVPTSFVMGALYLYGAGYTINMISLVGVLLALGIIVDDAIVVSENIQQHLERGKNPKDAAIAGATEMFKPVTVASLTTIFAFLPALMMSGSMGEVIKLIPIAVSILVLASLIESFIFLPIHSAHILKKDAKTRDWSWIQELYIKLIRYLIRYKKTSLLTFIIFVPLFTFFGLINSKFQMFPKFDASTIRVALKANVDTDSKEVHKILSQIQKDILERKDEFFIDHIGSVAGWRVDSAGNSETYPYVGQIVIELKKLKPQNFVDRFITPNLSFYYDSKNRTREQKSNEIAKRVKEFLNSQNYKKRFNLVDLDIVERKVGPIKSDLKIGLISNSDSETISFIKRLKSKLESLDGVVSVDDAIKFGVDEIKLKPNSYGESLGLNERLLGEILSNIYLEKRVGLLFDSEEMVDISIKGSEKDSLDEFINQKITLDNQTQVVLRDVVEFKNIESFEKIIKNFGKKQFYIYANVDPKILTATDALKDIEPILNEAKKRGIEITFKGEKEKQKDLKNDMIASLALALTLIMLSLLYLFNSFRETFMMLSIIPLSLLGVLAGHYILGINLSMPSIIGMLGLCGIVVNDGIIMMMNLKKAKNIEEILYYASKRFRPIILTSITTLIGMSSLIFFPTGQATIFQPMAVALGFGLLWGTVLNLLYLPLLYTLLNSKRVV